MLNLSEGGMLIEGGGFDIGEVAAFELAGPECNSVGVAKVAHRTSETTGLRFVRWDAATDRQIRELIVSRVREEELQAVELTPAEAFLG